MNASEPTQSASSPKSADLEQYATKLAAFLNDPASGVIRWPEDNRPTGSENDSARRVLFEVSGQLQDRYVSMWHFFAHREAFRECVRMFALLVRDIRRKFPFSTIVTDSPTTRHLVDASHAEIEAKDEVVEVKHLGEYPFDQPDARPIDFTELRVLVVCDVIQTGQHAEHVVNAVHRWGGRAVAVACVVLLNPAVEITRPVRPPASGEATPGREPVHVFPLCRFPIPLIAPETVKTEKVKFLDPNERSIPQISESDARQNYTVQFTDQEMFAHWEESQALDFGLFHVGRRKFTTALRITQLLKNETIGTTIWAGSAGKPGIRDVFAIDKPLIVTTYGLADQEFRDFVETKLKDEKKTPEIILTPDTDGHEVHYELLPEDARKLNKRNVVLLLAAAHSIDQVQAIAARLAIHGVRSVTVACLLNRLGPNPTVFLAGIERLLRGLGRQPTGSRLWQAIKRFCSRLTGLQSQRRHAFFRFWAVYNVFESTEESIDRMQEMVRATLTRFRTHTRVPAFQSWADHERKYFEAKPVTSDRFLSHVPEVLPNPYRVPNGAPVVRTKAGQLALLSHHARATHNYRPVIELLGKATEKEELYELVALLLPAVSFLKCGCSFTALRKSLVERIREEREWRYDRESGATPAGTSPNELPRIAETIRTEINEQIRLEAHLLFGLALFAAHDPEFDYRPIILEQLDSGLFAPGEPSKYPFNLLSALAENTFVWAIAVLLHMTEHDIGGPTNNPFKEQVRTRIQELVRSVERIHPPTANDPDDKFPDWVKESKRQAQTYLDHLLAELGDFEALRKDRVIRYLHRHILGFAQQHNFIVTHLRAAVEGLSWVCRRRQDTDESDERRNVRRVPFPPDIDPESGAQRKKLQTQLENAMYTSGVLQDLSQAFRRLFLFTRAERVQTAEFTEGPENPKSFAAQVGRLRALLQEAREQNAVSKQESEEVARLVTKVIGDVWGDKSVVAAALAEYVVPLVEELREALAWANEFSELKRLYPDLWKMELLRFQGEPAVQHPVLIDRYTLQEILRNALTNVRHSLDTLHSDSLPERPVYIAIIPPADSATLPPTKEEDHADYVVLEVWSAGGLKPPRSHRHNTKDQQRLELMGYGGDWELVERDGWVISRLRFVSRHRLQGKAPSPPKIIPPPPRFVGGSS